MKLHVWVSTVALGLAIGCAPSRPIIDTGARPEGVGGTIAGTASTTGETTPLSGRRVTAVNDATSARFETSTGANGSYTLKVPAGRYRLELELRSGETLATAPDPTDVAVGDIDSARDFVVTRR